MKVDKDTNSFYIFWLNMHLGEVSSSTSKCTVDRYITGRDREYSVWWIFIDHQDEKQKMSAVFNDDKR